MLQYQVDELRYTQNYLKSSQERMGKMLEALAEKSGVEVPPPVSRRSSTS